MSDQLLCFPYKDTSLNLHGQLVYILLLFVIESHHEKTIFCECVKKGPDRLHGNRAADQRICFRYINSTIPLLF